MFAIWQLDCDCQEGIGASRTILVVSPSEVHKKIKCEQLRVERDGAGMRLQAHSSELYSVAGHIRERDALRVCCAVSDHFTSVNQHRA